MQKNEEFTEPTWKEWIILKKISTAKDVSSTYKKDWADRIGAKHYDPIFSKVINRLKYLNIATSRPWIANYNIIDIDIKKLDIFIKNTQIYKELKDYLYIKRDIVIGV